MRITDQVRLNLRELSGAFGDIGTDFPLIVGLLRVVALNPATVFIVFGVLQILTGVVYGIPMPVQPLKAMAVIVITQKLPADILLAAGLGIGVCMLILAGTGTLTWLAKIVPHPVLRGIQLGLGLQLAKIALVDYVGNTAAKGYLLAAVAAVFIYVLRNNPRCPVTALLLLAGGLWGLFGERFSADVLYDRMNVPPWRPTVPTIANVITGFWVLV
ncbi:MAG: putative sulfate/molybdate transporter, partial [Candidatus Sumerlaeaceae bacterium]|nr:putative sulfate/molybdate transporter [Candidatus Sumerlaeaceae bacterium]